jgi:hypothetical protein
VLKRTSTTILKRTVLKRTLTEHREEKGSGKCEVLDHMCAPHTRTHPHPHIRTPSHPHSRHAPLLPPQDSSQFAFNTSMADTPRKHVTIGRFCSVKRTKVPWLRRVGRCACCAVLYCDFSLRAQQRPCVGAKLHVLALLRPLICYFSRPTSTKGSMDKLAPTDRRARSPPRRPDTSDHSALLAGVVGFASVAVGFVLFLRMTGRV